ncbi:Ail/Lom family outer membrane beta-barrel protein [Pantoea sp. RIT-PI-b]|uniref:Ail/Lom family outer membrane beta-barrel protein n=1 Tax=Pantoea sp. RIT-PI-b TaxID=1681195 RepID=UPI0006767F97|nr:Ail/Lom family outer membrane beta-barrel protein [Pantoea sp. RIT-PI-b]
MKYTIVSLAFLAAMTTSAFVKADNHTITLGYAQSKVKDFKDIHGLNVKYRYEWNSPLSIITSFTYLKGSDDGTYSAARDIITRHTDAKYYSLAVGPAYRINSIFSIYGLVGFNHSKVDYNYNWNNYGGGGYTDMGNFNGSGKSTNFMYGAGVQINPWSSLTIDIGYEGSKASYENKDYAINGFNIGVGYRF